MNNLIKKKTDALWEFLENNQARIRHLLGTDILIDKSAMITEIYIPAMLQHQKVFPKYKGINKGKTVVITGTGPTFEHYVPMTDVVHIGINRSIFRQDIRYDYMFVTDYDGEDDIFEKIFSCGYDLVKFFGVNYNRKGALIPEYLMERDNVEMYYVEGFNPDIYGTRIENSRKFVFPLDISTVPFKSYGTTFHIAFQFALWTHPEKIYVVGADSYGKTHAKGLDYGEVPVDCRIFIKPWRKMREFAEAYYPDIEIISLNPVGLKGIFKDVYSDGYKS